MIIATDSTEDGHIGSLARVDESGNTIWSIDRKGMEVFVVVKIEASRITATTFSGMCYQVDVANGALTFLYETR